MFNSRAPLCRFFNKTTKSRTKNAPLEQKQFFHRWSSDCLIMNSSRAFSFSRRPIALRWRTAAAHVTQRRSGVHFLFPEHIVASEVIQAD